MNVANMCFHAGSITPALYRQFFGGTLSSAQESLRRLVRAGFLEKASSTAYAQYIPTKTLLEYAHSRGVDCLAYRGPGGIATHDILAMHAAMRICVEYHRIGHSVRLVGPRSPELYRYDLNPQEEVRPDAIVVLGKGSAARLIAIEQQQSTITRARILNKLSRYVIPLQRSELDYVYIASTQRGILKSFDVDVERLPTFYVDVRGELVQRPVERSWRAYGQVSDQYRHLHMHDLHALYYE
nr:hypothetical protein [Oceanococcus sp. HetDA_MAG_MS8]